MKNNNLIQDSLQLAKDISNAASPSTQWIIVNIARDTSKDNLQPFLQYVATVYFYHYDAVSQFLEQEGVIEEKVEHKWFQKVVQFSKNQPEYKIQIMYDHISSCARRKGYFERGQKAVYFDNRSGHIEDYGPQLNGQYAILINKQKLEDFINWYSNLTPKWNDESSSMDFIGEKVVFEGNLEKKCVQLLIKNINAVVSYKDFYEVRGKSYDVEVGEHGKTLADDPSRVMFKKIRTKIKANSKLNTVLTLKESNGFGMFINKNPIS